MPLKNAWSLRKTCNATILEENQKGPSGGKGSLRPLFLLHSAALRHGFLVPWGPWPPLLLKAPLPGSLILV